MMNCKLTPAFKYRKILPVIILSLALCVFLRPAPEAKVTRETTEGVLFTTHIYYKDGREVAREVIDREGNIETTGKVPDEYYTQEKPQRSQPRKKPQTTYRVLIQPLPEPEKPQAAAVQLKQTIHIVPSPRLAWTNRGQFSEYRKLRVREYARLGFYPADYDPFSGLHEQLYRDVAFGTHWTPHSQFYAANPYLLITLYRYYNLMSAEEYCGLAEASYTPGKIEEVFSGARVGQFFTYADNYDFLLAICPVNAIDAGFRFMALDGRKCKNLDLAYFNGGRNIANSVCALNCSYFLNGSWNDISMPQFNAFVRIIEPYKPTCVYVKLWREMPQSKDSPEDLAYVISVVPMLGK